MRRARNAATPTTQCAHAGAGRLGRSPHAENAKHSTFPPYADIQGAGPSRSREGAFAAACAGGGRNATSTSTHTPLQVMPGARTPLTYHFGTAFGGRAYGFRRGLAGGPVQAACSAALAGRRQQRSDPRGCRPHHHARGGGEGGGEVHSIEHGSAALPYAGGCTKCAAAGSVARAQFLAPHCRRCSGTPCSFHTPQVVPQCRTKLQLTRRRNALPFAATGSAEGSQTLLCGTENLPALGMERKRQGSDEVIH